MEDDLILDLCRRGRQEGFARLLLTYQERVYRRAYSFLHHREDALDLTQEVFLRAIRGLPAFTPGRPFWPWLRRITTNLCLNYLRDRPHLLSLDQALEQADNRAEVDPAEAALASWGAQHLSQAMGRLPPMHRIALVLRHKEELSYDEIARVMELPLGTVKTYIFRARQMLKHQLAYGEG